MAEPFIGQITMFAGNFAPRAWAFCDGQLLAISSNSALFSILGTTYGGDGRTTFALPDLRSRVPIHPGTGPGLSTYKLGQRGGQQSVTLTINQLPQHNHIVNTSNLQAITPVSIPVVSGLADGNNPEESHLAEASAGNIYSSGTPDATLPTFNAVGGISGTITTLNAGNQQPFSIVQPYNTVNYIIALQGIFPSRN